MKETTMQIEATIYHPAAPWCTYYAGSITDGDDFITLRLGSALTNSLTLHFTNTEFRQWTRELDRQIRLIENQAIIETTRRERFRSMTSAQVATLMRLCKQYGVPFDPLDYHPQFDLPSGYIAGWIGGVEHQAGTQNQTIYVGVDPEGAASS